jgi:hypothetical protein
MPRDDNPFRVLGLPRSASPDDVRAAYRRLARRLHPDTRPADARGPEAHRAMAALNEAYRRALAEAGAHPPGPTRDGMPFCARHAADAVYRCPACHGALCAACLGERCPHCGTGRARPLVPAPRRWSAVGAGLAAAWPNAWWARLALAAGVYVTLVGAFDLWSRPYGGRWVVLLSPPLWLVHGVRRVLGHAGRPR